MKIKTVHLLALLIAFIFQNSLKGSSIPYEENLCYMKDYASQIKVSKIFSPNQLTFAEKLKFKTKSSKTKVSKKLSSNDYSKIEEQLQNTNIVPAYVDLPYKKITNKDATTSYYTIDYSKSSQGWIGGYFAKNPKESQTNALYTEDIRNGIGYRYVARSAEDRIWQSKYQKYQTSGLLTKYVWVSPKNDIVNKYRSQGYNIVSNNEKSLVLANTTTTITWDKSSYTQTVHINDKNGALVSKVIKNYSFNDVYGVPLLNTMTMVEYLTFEYGDCYQEITSINYSEYSGNCGELDFRHSLPDESNLNDELVIYPNPSSSTITIDVPQIEHGNMTVRDMLGNTLYMKKLSGEESEVQINISQYPKGMYLLTIEGENQMYQSKFTKQ